jgi:hypothetical protein
MVLCMNFSCKDAIKKFVDYNIEELGIKHNSEGDPLLTVDPSHPASPYAISAVVRQALKDLGTMDCDLDKKAKSKLGRIGQAEHEKYLENLAEEAIRNSSVVYHNRKMSEGPAGAGSSLRDHECIHKQEVCWPISSNFILKNKKLDGIYGNTELFDERSKEVIGRFVGILEVYKENYGIWRLLKDLGISRHKIAKESRTESAHRFGSLREIGPTIAPERWWLSELYSSFSGYSEEYNNIIQQKLYRFLQGSVFDESLNFLGSYKDSKIECNNTDNKRFFEKKLKVFFSVEAEASKGNFLGFARLLEINGVIYKIATYIMREDRVEKEVGVIHLCPTLFHDLIINAINPVFLNIMLWSKEDNNELIEMVAQLQYIIANMCPYARGSAAVCEWIERIIYQYHGLEVRYNPDKCINLEALTSSLEEFLRVYPSCIRLEEARPS